MLSGEQLRKRRERVCGVSLSIGLRGDLIKQMVAGDRAKTAVNKPKPLGKSPHKARNLLGQIGDAGRTPRYSRRTRGAARGTTIRHCVPSSPGRCGAVHGEALHPDSRASWQVGSTMNGVYSLRVLPEVLCLILNAFSSDTRFVSIN